nr:hypothetical protein Iba_chr04aCG18180 [Ipomoea batatas]
MLLQPSSSHQRRREWSCFRSFVHREERSPTWWRLSAGTAGSGGCVTPCRSPVRRNLHATSSSSTATSRPRRSRSCCWSSPSSTTAVTVHSRREEKGGRPPLLTPPPSVDLMFEELLVTLHYSKHGASGEKVNGEAAVVGETLEEIEIIIPLSFHQQASI